MANEAPSVGLEGVCSICGNKGVFARGAAHSTREGFPCPSCRASLRYRDQAQVLIDEYGNGLHLGLSQVARAGLLADLSIYEVAIGGPFKRILSPTANYINSYYWEDTALGHYRDGVRCEDLTKLTFDRDSFDLVITSDVMEHVFNPDQAFAEIFRVLKPGGIHVFTIPTAWPFPLESTSRARLSGGKIEHLLPERYHRAGDGSQSLVVTDFGAALVKTLSTIGYRTQVIRRSAPAAALYTNATFVTRKP